MRSTLCLTTMLWLLLGSAGTARADTPAEGDAARLVACDKGWQHCKTNLEAALEALAEANRATDKEARARQACSEELTRAVQERDEAASLPLTRARWALVAGMGGSTAVAAGVALAARGDRVAGISVGVVGLVALATGVVLTW